MRLFTLSLFCCACGAPEGPAPAAPEAPTSEVAGEAARSALPGDSLYQLQLPLLDQEGASLGLDHYRGSPVLISMFYASCTSACPLLVQDLVSLEQGLPEAQRQRLRVLLVSLTPERDSPADLVEVAKRHGVDLARWTLAVPPPGRERELAAALGIVYRPLPDGQMNHSSVITLLDPEGRPVASLEGLRQDPAPLLEKLSQM